MDNVLAVDVKTAGINKVAKASGSYFFLKDTLGSISDIVDSSGNLVQHTTYSSFGKIVKIVNNSGGEITSDPNVSSMFAFTGREFDSETGLYYYRTRFYSPEIGRFISSDPHAGWRSKPISFNNVYSYAYNNPMKYKDPNGKFGVLVAMGIAGLINGAISSYRGGDFVTGFAVGAIGTLFVATGAHLAVLASGATAGSGAAIFAGAIGGGLTNLAIASAMGVKGSGLILAFAAGAFGGAAIGKWGFSWTWKGETAQVNTANGVNDFNRGSVGSLPESPSAPSPATGQPSGTDTGGNGFTFCGIEGEQC